MCVETVELASSNRREELAALMAELFKVEGCINVRAVAPGYASPENIIGSVKDHVPAVTCRRNDERGTAVILDTLLVEGGSGDLNEVISRLQLFASAVKAVGGEMHLVVPARVGDSDGEELARAMLRRLGLTANRIWPL